MARYSLLPMCAVALVVSAACGGRIAPPEVRGPTRQPVTTRIPHISWAISRNSADGAEHLVCRSDTSAACIVPASTSDGKAFVAFHVYLHPSIHETKYTGSVQVTFLNGFGPDIHEGIVDSTVKPGELPFDVSVMGPVTEIPGVYVTSISLLADSAMDDPPRRIEDDIAVTVRPNE